MCVSSASYCKNTNTAIKLHLSSGRKFNVKYRIVPAKKKKKTSFSVCMHQFLKTSTERDCGSKIVAVSQLFRYAKGER